MMKNKKSKSLEIQKVDPSKRCLSFLEKRLKRVDYRGLQISQHNRYTLEIIVGMLQILYDLVGEEKMEIRTEDLSKRPINKENEKIYAEYVNRVKKNIGIGTQDSIRKNFFVDFHRMGLIERYDKDGISQLPYSNKRYKIKSVSIATDGLSLIRSKNLLEKQILFSEYVDRLFGGFATQLIEILSELDHLTIEEYTFFISFIGKTVENIEYDIDAVIELVKDYRNLSGIQKDAVEKFVKEYADPDTFNGNKKNKRDFHNWINESQQIFYLLNQTALYEYDKENHKLRFKVKDKSETFFNRDSIKRLKRSNSCKKDYFREHNIGKHKGYELHHIVPLLKAKNADHFFLLDVWENLLYLDAKTHAIITQNGNKQIMMKILENNDIILSDLQDELNIKYNDNVFYAQENKNIMLYKNEELLKTI